MKIEIKMMNNLFSGFLSLIKNIFFTFNLVPMIDTSTINKFF